MKRRTTLAAAALSIVLATGAITGCGGQSGSAPDGTKATQEQASDAIESSDLSLEELAQEIKAGIANLPQQQSLTIPSESVSKYTGTDSPDPTTDEMSETDVYKFDMSGGTLRSTSEYTMSGVTMKYYTDGDRVVCITDGPAYGGSADEFMLTQSDGYLALIDETFGDLSTVVDCATSIEKTLEMGQSVYSLELDAQKYINSDEILSIMSDSGSPVISASYVIAFDADGNYSKISNTVDYGTSTSTKTFVFSDFGTTTVDKMPEATKTYADMQADMQAKIEELLASSASTGVETEAE